MGTADEAAEASLKVDGELKERATAVRKLAHAPYSEFHVGAAARTGDGSIVVGCNVENASYGLSLCAECGVVSNLFASGGTSLVELVAVGPDDAIVQPCGRCRQVLFEVGGPGLIVNGRPLSDLLPNAFGPANLEEG